MKECGNEMETASSHDLPNFQHAALDPGLDQLSGIRNPHFLHHIGSVGLHGLHADLEPIPDFLVLESRPNKFQNFLFSAC